MSVIDITGTSYLSVSKIPDDSISISSGNNGQPSTKIRMSLKTATKYFPNGRVHLYLRLEERELSLQDDPVKCQSLKLRGKSQVSKFVETTRLNKYNIKRKIYKFKYSKEDNVLKAKIEFENN